LGHELRAADFVCRNWTGNVIKKFCGNAGGNRVVAFI
jgi:hypothetical protein